MGAAMHNPTSMEAGALAWFDPHLFQAERGVPLKETE